MKVIVISLAPVAVVVCLALPLSTSAVSVAGVASVYQRQEFRDERKRALEQWAADVGALRASVTLNERVVLQT